LDEKLRPTLVGSYLLVVAFAALAIIPIAWSLLVSLHLTYSLFGSESYSLTGLTLSNYATLVFGTAGSGSAGTSTFGVSSFHLWFTNSVIVAVVTTLLVIPVSLLAGYGFGAFSFRGRNFSFLSLLMGSILPFPAVAIPLYQWFATLHLVNTYPGLIIPLIANVVPVFWMTQYIATLPHEIFDAAKVDGASDYGILWRIVVPLAAPGMAIVGIYIFWTTWNQFLWPLIISTDGSMYTLPVGIASLYGGTIFATNWGLWMAAVDLSLLPLFVAFVLFQRYFIKGLTMGALKG
jgi:ABC-type glycerol-3-phosphate transport system permease component